MSNHNLYWKSGSAQVLHEITSNSNKTCNTCEHYCAVVQYTICSQFALKVTYKFRVLRNTQFLVMFPAQQKRDARVDIFCSKLSYQYLYLLILCKSYLNQTYHPRPGHIVLTLVIIIDNTILSILHTGSWLHFAK